MSSPLHMIVDDDDCVVVNEDLRISFRRTVRVPDSTQSSHLPPDLGAFPLQPVSRYADKLDYTMASKGGLFFPMYQSEAMWIDFASGGTQAYMIKIYVGGINVVSGESSVEDAGTKLRRQTKYARWIQGQAPAGSKGTLSLQDYVIVPGQQWLDGIAMSTGTVRQFVAMPFGNGYSVESQVNGKDAAGGIQIEVTPYNMSQFPKIDNHHLSTPFSKQIFVKTHTGNTITLNINELDTIGVVKERICEKTGVSRDSQRLTYQGKDLFDDNTALHYDLQSGATLNLVLRLPGGLSSAPKQREMSIAAGGKIHQALVQDHWGQNWAPERATIFNVQILDSIAYQAVTGAAPPTKPIGVQTYVDLGLPFYKMYEEPSAVKGDLDRIKSVAQLELRAEAFVEPRTVVLDRACVGLASPAGPLRPFRTLADIRDELQKVHVASF